MIVGCYSMDLYCDSDPCPTTEKSVCSCLAQLSGSSEQECMKDAKKRGWSFVKDGYQANAFCPNCTKRRKRNRK